MPEGELSAARTRIETMDRRLAALQDLGIDTAGLRSQLSLARTRIDEGGHGDAHAVLDEVAEAARRLAAGATARSSEWRGLPRERVVEELRRIVAEGGAGEAVSALREHVDDRLREFERRLRDQFARELAQIIAARPWAKDLAAAPITDLVASASDSGLDQVRAEVDALIQRVAGELHAELDQVRRLASEPRAADPGLRDDLERVRREVEALGRSARGPDPALLRALVDEALAGRASLSAPSPTDDLLRGLVVSAGAIQDRLSERLLGLEQRIGGLVDRLMPVLPTPLTAQTAIHIDTGNASDCLTLGGGTTIPGADLSPFNTTIPAAVHLSDAAEPPSGSDWIFPHDDSRSAPPGGPTEVARDPSRPMVAIEQKLREAASAPADASEAKTAAIGVEQLAVTGPVANDDRPPALSIDEALVRRLIEARLATWRPSPGDDLVSDEAEQARQLVRLLPSALLDTTVRTSLFAALALEATARPGVLAELTGLRGFLRRELRLAVDEIKKEMGVGV